MHVSEKSAIRLVALDGSHEIVLGPTPIVIGRHPRCEVRLGSLRVSRHHCCLTDLGGEVEVRDLGSTNGVRINGRLVISGRLRPGDRLTIAHLEFRVLAAPITQTLRTVSCSHELR